MKRRRLIKQWTAEYVAIRDYECERCGTIVCAGSYYLRRVWALPKRLEVEREHGTPQCPNRYYEYGLA